MKIAPPQIHTLTDDSSVATMSADGELENRRLFDEEAINTNVAALELSGVIIEKVNFTDAQFERINARDIAARQSDFSGVSFSSGNVTRMTFTNCRMTGFDASRTSFRDVVFSGCKLDMANFRFSNIRRAQFIDCTLLETDFLGATLHEVSFQNCTLERVVFHQTKAQKLDFRTSQLHELAGWQSLKGALIDSVQLSGVAPYLARELGLIVRDN